MSLISSYIDLILHFLSSNISGTEEVVVQDVISGPQNIQCAGKN